MPAPQAVQSFFRVAYQGAVHVRTAPSFDALFSGSTLVYNEIFAVSEEVPAADGRIYLRLADGRGWVFDDSGLLPHSPSVVRGQWMQTGSVPAYMSTISSPTGVPSLLTDAIVAQQEVKKRRRRKRGGVKRNKAKRRLAAQMDEENGDADTDTEVPSSDADADTDVPSSDADATDA
jgi:hypothetical protein